MALTANEMINYLSEYKKEFCSFPEQYISDKEKIEMFDLNECKAVIEKWIEDDPFVKEEFTNIETYKPSMRVSVNVENKDNGGLVCLFGNKKTIKGFISAVDKHYNLDYFEYDSINEGDCLLCEIMEYDYSHKSFQLKYISKLE